MPVSEENKTLLSQSRCLGAASCSIEVPRCSRARARARRPHILAGLARDSNTARALCRHSTRNRRSWTRLSDHSSAQRLHSRRSRGSSLQLCQAQRLCQIRDGREDEPTGQICVAATSVCAAAKHALHSRRTKIDVWDCIARTSPSDCGAENAGSDDPFEHQLAAGNVGESKKLLLPGD